MSRCPGTCDHSAAPAEVSNLQNRFETQLVWRGFDFNWTYNHRINRIGSFVWPQAEGVAKMVATAASGTGQDQAVIDGYGTWVAGAGVTLIGGACTLELVGHEGEVIQARSTVRIPDAPEGAAAVVLGGFDLAVGLSEAERSDSDKLQRLMLGVRDLRRDGDALVFRVEGALVARCRSLECKPFEKKTSYRLQVWYTVLAGPGLVAQSPVAISDAYAWDTETEVDLATRFTDVALPLDAHTCLVGLSRVEFILDREHHVLQLCAKVDSPNPLPNGVWRFGWKAGVKNWRAGMGAANPLSFPAAGSVSLGLRAVALGLREGACAPQVQQGCVDWPGGNESNAREESICGFTVRRGEVG